MTLAAAPAITDGPVPKHLQLRSILLDRIDQDLLPNAPIPSERELAVAFGVIFWAWGLVWSATESAFAFFPPAQALIYGIWLLPGVVGGLQPGERVVVDGKQNLRPGSRIRIASAGAPAEAPQP